MQIRFSLPNGNALSAQLHIMNSFAQARTSQNLLSVWPQVENVLIQNGILPGEVGALPTTDDQVHPFQRTILDAVRPRLSNAVITLFHEPSRATVDLVKRLTPGRAEDFRRFKVLDHNAGQVLIDSATLYFKLGIQIERVRNFLTIEATMPPALTRDIRFLFALYELPTKPLENLGSAVPSSNFFYQTLILDAMRIPIEGRLVNLMRYGESWDNLSWNHDITPRTLKDAAAIGIVSPDLMRLLHKQLNPPPMWRLAMDTIREHPRRSTFAGAMSASTIISAAAVNYIMGGSGWLSIGLLAVPIALLISLAFYVKATKKR